MQVYPGSGRSPGGVHSNLLQYIWLNNSMDRGAWQTTVHRVTKSWTWLKQLSMHYIHISNHHVVYFKYIQFFNYINKAGKICNYFVYKLAVMALTILYLSASFLVDDYNHCYFYELTMCHALYEFYVYDII